MWEIFINGSREPSRINSECQTAKYWNTSVANQFIFFYAQDDRVHVKIHDESISTDLISQT